MELPACSQAVKCLTPTAPRTAFFDSGARLKVSSIAATVDGRSMPLPSISRDDRRPRETDRAAPEHSGRAVG